MGRKKEARRSGAELRALMERFNLRGNKGADVCAAILGIDRKTVFIYLSVGISRNNYLLLEMTLEKRAEEA